MVGFAESRKVERDHPVISGQQRRERAPLQTTAPEAVQEDDRRTVQRTDVDVPNAQPAQENVDRGVRGVGGRIDSIEGRHRAPRRP